MRWVAEIDVDTWPWVLGLTRVYYIHVGWTSGKCLLKHRKWNPKGFGSCGR